MSLSNYQYDEIKREYDKKQLINHRIQTERKNEVYAAVLSQKGIDLKELDVKKTALYKQKLIAQIDLSDTTDIEKAISELTAQKAQLIKDCGYSPSYFEEVYECSLCKDTGYTDAGRCICMKKACIELLYASVNNKNLNREHTFKNFNYSLFSTEADPKYKVSPYDNMREAARFCEGFARDFDSKVRNVFLYGNVGAGKTYLTDCIANELINTLHSVVYMSAHDFFELVADYEFNKSQDDLNIPAMAQSLLECELLIIDDLGSEGLNTFTQSMLFYYINERLLLKKSTIISSNYDLNKIKESYSERISSRIKGNYTIIPVFGRDLRTQK